MCNFENEINFIKDELFTEFPIKGGYGKSFEDAIEFEVIAANNFVQKEYQIVKLIGSLNDRDFSVKKQQLKFYNDKAFDILHIIEIINNKLVFVTELYFDITACWNKKSKNRK